MPKSVALIKAKEYNNFLACIDSNIHTMSDFELFAFVCENISLMQGSMLRKNFLDALKSDTGKDIPPSALKNRETQKLLWRAVNGAYDLIPDFQAEQEDNVCRTDYSNPKNLNLLLQRDNIPDDIDLFIEQIDQSVMADLSGLKYRRPDEYHVALTYDKIKRGEKCDSKDFCALICWILCKALMKKDITLYLLADESMETAYSVLSLIEGRKLYPDIRLCIHPSTHIAEGIAELCLNSRKKNISPEIIFSEEDFDIENIKALFLLVPASRVYFCDFLSCESRNGELENAVRTAVQEK